MEEKIKSVMAKVFRVSTDEIKDDTSAHTIAAWDSLRHLDMILSLEQEFAIKFADEEIPTMINYQMILNTIKSYQE